MKHCAQNSCSADLEPGMFTCFLSCQLFGTASMKMCDPDKNKDGALPYFLQKVNFLHISIFNSQCLPLEIMTNCMVSLAHMTPLQCIKGELHI